MTYEPQSIPRSIVNAALSVQTNQLRKRFGKNVALSGLDLTVPANSFYVLVGPNGSGKSTTVRILLDLVRADSGVAELLGFDSRKGAAARAQIGWVPDSHSAHYSWMSMGEQIDYHAAYYANWDHAYARQLEQSLAIVRERKIQNSSRGEVRRVQLLLALAHRPSLLLLDEPTDGLDPAAREIVLGTIAEHLSDSETTVLLATHLVHEVDRLADHIGVIRGGSVVAQLRRDELGQKLRSYSMHVPAEWDEFGAARALQPLKRNGRQLEKRWIIWGEESDVAERLASHGAQVYAASSVSLEEASVALTTTTAPAEAREQ